MKSRAAAILLILAPLAAGAEGTDPGRALFEGLPGAPGQVVIGSNRVEATRFPCRGCHGRDGSGGSEGDTPAITWDVLSAPGHSRPAYDAAAFAQLLATGRSPGGHDLSRQMPRYDLEAPETAALIGHLARLPAQQRRGIHTDRIVLAVPGSPATAATATEMAAALQNAFGVQLPPLGIHGRRVDIITVGGTPKEMAEALGQRAAAIVAPMPGPGLALEFLMEAGPPVLFPVAHVSDSADPLLLRSLLASRETIVRALARRIAEEGRGSVAIVASMAEDGEIAAAQMPALSTEIIASGEVIPNGTEAVLVVPGAEGALGDIIRTMPSQATLYADLQALARHRIEIDARGLRTIGSFGGAVLLRAAHEEGATPNHIYATVIARVLIEALVIAGRNLTQAGLVAAVGELSIGELGIEFDMNEVAGTSEVVLVEFTPGALRPAGGR